MATAVCLARASKVREILPLLMMFSDDLGAGFQGAHTLFRELFVHEVDNVVDTDGALTTYKNAVATKNSDGTYLAQTYGVRPLPEVVEGLREGSTSCSYGENVCHHKTKILKQAGSSSMELKATVSSASGAVGLIVAAAPDMSEYTQIIYEPSNYTLLVVRDHSSTLDEFNNATVTGFFSPYTIKCGDKTEQEAITMDVFLDGSLLEVYINERFALSTRIYPASTCSTGERL